MNLLAIETATSVCSVALWVNGIVSVELTLNRPRAHAENLVPMIADALRYDGLQAADLDVVAVSAGPGSYTGLRIGTSTAKGLVAAVDAALVEVSSLEALAYGSRGGLAEDEVIVAAFDARRDEVFAAAFRIAPSSPDRPAPLLRGAAPLEGTLTPLRPTTAVLVGDVPGWLGRPASRIILVGDGAEKVQTALSEAGMSAHRLPDRHPGAGSVAMLGAERFIAGDTVDHAVFEPHYLKEFVAKKPSASAFEKLPF